MLDGSASMGPAGRAGRTRARDRRGVRVPRAPRGRATSSSVRGRRGAAGRPPCRSAARASVDPWIAAVEAAPGGRGRRRAREVEASRRRPARAASSRGSRTSSSSRCRPRRSRPSRGPRRGSRVRRVRPRRRLRRRPRQGCRPARRSRGRRPRHRAHRDDRWRAAFQDARAGARRRGHGPGRAAPVHAGRGGRHETPFDECLRRALRGRGRHEAAPTGVAARCSRSGRSCSVAEGRAAEASVPAPDFLLWQRAAARRRTPPRRRASRGRTSLDRAAGPADARPRRAGALVLRRGGAGPRPRGRVGVDADEGPDGAPRLERGMREARRLLGSRPEAVETVPRASLAESASWRTRPAARSSSSPTAPCRTCPRGSGSSRSPTTRGTPGS